MNNPLKMTEKDLQKLCEDYLKLFPLISYEHFHEAPTYGVKGVPDIVGFISLPVYRKLKVGFACELKIGNKKPTPLQFAYLEKLKSQEFIVAWFNDFEDFKQWISGLVEEVVNLRIEIKEN